MQPSRFLAAIIAPTLVITSAVVLGIALPMSASADDGTTPSTSVSSVGTGDKSFILAGEDATFDIGIQNNSGADKYNLSVTALVPSGVEFVSASFLGTPTRYTHSDALPNRMRNADTPPATTCPPPLVPATDPLSPLCAPPAGYELWVWQNVSDLPDTATATSTLIVRPDATLFSVGTDALDVVVTGYTSNDPTLLPIFDGSTSVATSDTHTSKPGAGAASTDVRALRVTKSEPSPEHDLLRGIHDNTTTYTLLVENTGQGPTDLVTVTDYLPAGLEYLGAGGVDNSEISPWLYDGAGDLGGTLEYPGAADLTATPTPSPDTGDWSGSGETVETVVLDATTATALGLAGAGVYTKVTWTLGTLSGGTPQAFAATAGTPGQYTIRYRAAVPLFENTMDWESPSGTAPAITGEQTANLNNNTGASTRHGINDPDYNYAQSQTNAVQAAGTYQGLVTDPSDRLSSDSDQVTVEAVDLRVEKSVDMTAFDTGQLATYTLNLWTSEYTDADGITLTDNVANGLCPAFPDQVPEPTLTIDGAAVTKSTWAAAVGVDCDYPNPAGSVTGALVQSIDFATSGGDFTVVFEAATMPDQDFAQINYTVLQRRTYIPTTSEDGATSSGDVMQNTVEILGTTTSIPALAGVESASGAPAYGVEKVADDSQASIESNFSGLTKEVLERADQEPTSTGGGTWVDKASEPFALGDSVWYKVRIDFAENIETRNPRLSDFLPQGVEFVGASYRWNLGGVVPDQTTLTTTPEPDYIGAPTGSPALDPRSLTWNLGSDVFMPDSSDRFMPIGSWVEFYIEGRVVGQSASADLVDKPENQAKYQQENVTGDVFFLRDDAAIDLDFGATLVKGIRDIDGDPAGGYAFNSDVDHLQVVQGDDVTYRVDVTAPATDMSDFVVWDALPPGIAAADVDPTSFSAALVDQVGPAPPVETPLMAGFTAVALDPSDPGYPAVGELAAAYAGRSIVKWLVTAIIPGSDAAADTVRGLTLGYTVTVPDGSTASDPGEVTESYENTASIVRYNVENNGDGMNGDGTSTLVPTGPDTVAIVPAGPTEFETTDEDTVDPSDVFLPAASLSKSLISTYFGRPSESGNVPPAVTADSYTDAGNGAAQIVQGEYATFRYSLTVPADTSVSGGVLADDGKLRWTGAPNVLGHEIDYTVVPTLTTAPMPAGFDPVLWATFAFDNTTGALTFPATYQNVSGADEVFSVNITVWVADPPSSLPDFANGKVLTNTARFSFDNPNVGPTPVILPASANVTYIEPSIDITKSANPDAEVHIGEDVDYTITASNAAGRPKTYENVIVDDVPVGLIVDPTSWVGPTNPVAWDAGITTGAGGTITWNLAELAGGASVVYGYTAQIVPGSGGAEQYENTVAITGGTVPVGVVGTPGIVSDNATETISAVSASIAKGVRLEGSADPFAATASGPIGDTMEYQVVVTLEPGINYWDPSVLDQLPAGVDYVSGSAVVSHVGPGVVDADWLPVVYDAGADTLTFDYAGDILVDAGPAVRTITFTYQALLSNSVAPTVNDLDNTATFGWLKANDDPATKETVDDTAGVDVLNPAFGIDKSVSDATPDPGDTFDYDIAVINGGTTTAYNMVFVDTVPAGIVVDTASITPAYSALTGDIANGLGGTIEWQVAGPLSNVAPGNTLSFGYSAGLVPSAQIGDAATFVNTAKVDHFESFPTGGRDYDPTGVQDDATVNPAFPNVTLTKTATSGTTAYAGESFGWTLTLRNTGDGPAQTIAIGDVLPPNWEYLAGSAQINRGNTGLTSLADPSISTVGAVQTLTWSSGTVAPTTPALPAASGSPTDPSRTIVVRFLATPTTAALVNPGVTQTGPVAVPHTNTLTATTTDTSGVTGNLDGSYTGPDSTANAFIQSADIQMIKTAGTTVAAGGPAAPGWTLVVKNNGPSTAVGRPFEVFDEWGTLPAGVTVTGVAGTGWTCAPPAPTAVTCERTNIADTLASGASFPAITITVQVAASFDPDDSPISNTASVSGKTYDPDPSNNEDDADLAIDVEADLSIVKSLVTASPNAGGGISWSLTASNLGPSDSASTTADPIEITDTIPTWVDDVTLAAPLPTGWSLVTPGPFGPGDTVTIRLGDGLVMPSTGAGSTAAFTLSGTLDASLPASTSIANTAVIEPGPTTDPDPTNNESTATTTPGIDTTLDISKTRVAWDGTAWVTTTDPVIAGDPVSYRVEIENMGLADAQNVTVTDQVEPYLSFDSFSSEVGTWTGPVAPGALGVDQVFSLTGALLPGDVASFIVTLVIDSAHATAVVNTVVGDADNSTNQPDDSDNSATNKIVDLGVVKSHTGDAVAGSPLGYTLTVTNYGPSDSDGPIDIVDTLPVPFGYELSSSTVSVSGGAAVALEPVVAGQDLTWSVGAGDPTFTLPAGDTIVIVFNATVPDDLGAQTGLVNTVQVTGPDTDPVLTNNEDDDPTTIVTRADMTIVKTVSTPQIAGDTVTYTLTVDNDGPSAARNVQVVDTPEAGLTIESITGSGWTCTLATAVCTMSEHPVGITTISVVARIGANVPDSTVLNNAAELSWTDSRPGPHSDDDDVDVTVTTSADLVLSKTAVDLLGATIGTANAGEQIGYVLAVTNNGPSDAVGPLDIVDTLPAGFSYAGIQAGGPPDWSCSALLQVVTCTTAPGLAAGDSAVSLTILVDIDDDLVSGTTTVTRTNVATATSGTSDPDPSNNTDIPAVVTVSALIDLVIVKTHDPADVRIGDPLTFDFAIENLGPTTATGVTVTDTIPAGLDYVDIAGSDPAWSVVSVTPDAITSETVVVLAMTGTIPPGNSAPMLRVNVEVRVEAYPSVDNVAVVTGAEPEDTSTLPDNTSTDPVTVPPQSTLVLTKTAVGTFEVGSDGHYRIDVENLGITEDPGPIVVTDVLPAGLDYRSATGTGVVCAQTSGTVTCTSTGPLAVGDTLTIELVVAVGIAAYPEVTNTAVVTTPTEQLPGGDPDDTVVVKVGAGILAYTGAAIGGVALLALALFVAGGIAFLVTRRRGRRGPVRTGSTE